MIDGIPNKHITVITGAVLWASVSVYMYTVLIQSYSAVLLLHMASPFLLCVIESVCVLVLVSLRQAMFHVLGKCQQLL